MLKMLQSGCSGATDSAVARGSLCENHVYSFSAQNLLGGSLGAKNNLGRHSRSWQ
jgi:hypothetical protein